MNKTLKQKAFTLAETLIVMGVIGVVAALTIPSLSNSTNDKDVVAKVRKNHTALEDAFGRMIATYEEFDSWGANLTTNDLGKRLFGSMKLTKNCDTTVSGCFSADANLIKSDGSTSIGSLNGTSSSVYRVILADGASVGIFVDNATCTATAGSNVSQDLKEICGTILVDVDGPSKGKSKHGLDLFTYYITKKGIYPVGTADDTKFKFKEACTQKGAPTTATGSNACTAWVVYNANLDYKKADTTGKCLSNTNKTLDFTTNTSCD
ncbi:type II secretion system protein [bacterium]|nr:type II secretion system protein [bacterium]